MGLKKKGKTRTMGKKQQEKKSIVTKTKSIFILGIGKLSHKSISFQLVLFFLFKYLII